MNLTTIIATEFTPLLSLLGGVLIGLSAVLLMLMLGRVAGISGILRGALLPSTVNHERSWRLSFLLGLMVAYGVYGMINGTAPVLQFVAPSWLSLIAGLLVGFGVALANGCTSGHGVCGLARLSPRSLVAVISFMTSAVVTVTVIRHLLPSQ